MPPLLLASVNVKIKIKLLFFSKLYEGVCLALLASGEKKAPSFFNY